MRKKPKNRLNRENQKKKPKKPNSKKKLIKQIKILKKPTVRFRFYKPETEKTEPKPEKTEPKPSRTEKTEPNRFEPVFVLKTNRTEPKLVGLNRFWF
jgi:hypothetical protein